MRSPRLRGEPPIRLRCASFSGLVLPDAPPDHSTISPTRRLIDRRRDRAGHRQDESHELQGMPTSSPDSSPLPEIIG